jgi:hypothetical protein
MQTAGEACLRGSFLTGPSMSPGRVNAGPAVFIAAQAIGPRLLWQTLILSSLELFYVFVFSQDPHLRSHYGLHYRSAAGESSRPLRR